MSSSGGVTLGKSFHSNVLVYPAVDGYLKFMGLSERRWMASAFHILALDTVSEYLPLLWPFEAMESLTFSQSVLYYMQGY